jgi:hypothetical protein
MESLFIALVDALTKSCSVLIVCLFHILEKLSSHEALHSVFVSHDDLFTTFLVNLDFISYIFEKDFSGFEHTIVARNLEKCISSVKRNTELPN